VPSTRVLIADDHQIVRSGIRSILEAEPGWEVCAEAADGREAVEAARLLKPDLVILDFFMPRLNGLEAARQILHDKPLQRILFLTVMDNEETARQALEAGAKGYLLKTDAATDLVVAVKTLLRNCSYFSTQVENMVLNGFLKPHLVTAEDHAAELTSREREIVQLLAEGCATKEVAAILGMSIKTAETHRNNIMRKLKIHCVAELVVYAIRHNIVQSTSSDWWQAAAA
jgi:DNA-binding NarL/FixJ family response regulator